MCLNCWLIHLMYYNYFLTLYLKKKFSHFFVLIYILWRFQKLMNMPCSLFQSIIFFENIPPFFLYLTHNNLKTCRFWSFKSVFIFLCTLSLTSHYFVHLLLFFSWGFLFCFVFSIFSPDLLRTQSGNCEGLGWGIFFFHKGLEFASAGGKMSCCKRGFTLIWFLPYPTNESYW